MKKEEKTNVMRVLDAKKISYTSHSYNPDPTMSGEQIAALLGEVPENVFKTLVTQGKSGSYYVFVIPIAEEVDLKAAARSVGEKSVEMIHVKDLTTITGYVRGGCSPLGMKKAFPTVIDESAEQFDKMYISGGRIGTTIALNPQDLAKVVRASFAPILAR